MRKHSAKLNSDWSEGERLAKYLARCGVASRRASESLIEAGKITVNGRKVTTPAFKVTGRELIKLDGVPVKSPEATRLWLYHKPAGLLATHNDPKGRPTLFENLPKSMPYLLSVGRLDLNTEGLLLLTNDGALARALEQPSNSVERIYRARAHGEGDQAKLARLKAGICVDGEQFGAIEAILERQTGANCWLTVSLKEGKNREVRRALQEVDLQVNRLIRTHYGPFELGELSPGALAEVSSRDLKQKLADILPEFKAFAPDPRQDKAHKSAKRPHSGRSTRRKPAGG